MNERLYHFFQNNLQKIIGSVFTFCFYTVILLHKNFLNVYWYRDEWHFFETTIRFSKQIVPSLNLLKNYAELNTPLPFIIGGWWANIFGQNIQTLRILTFLLSFFVTNLFIWQSRVSLNKTLICILGLWLFPNYYLCTVYYYTDIFAITAMLLGIIAYLHQRHFFSGLFFIAAICCRQYMIAFPVAIIAYECWGVWIKTNGIFLTINKLLQRRYLTWYVLACFSLIPWLILWSGFAPAAEMTRQYYDHISTYKWGFVLYASAVVAVYYVIPETIFSRNFRYYLSYPRQNPYLFLIFLVLISTIVVWYPAKQTQNAYFNLPYLGNVDLGLMTVGIKGIFKQITFGLLMLISLMRFVKLDANLGGWVFVVNTLLLGKAQLSWDKYSLPTAVVLWFLMVFNEQNKEELMSKVVKAD